MRTPRTVDEIADKILPADGDGIHERALCLLLAEHEADIARIYGARCEPGVQANSEPKDAGNGDAPGSTAPTTEEVENDCRWLEGDIGVKTELKDYGGAQRLAQLIPRLRALVADRDRLLTAVHRLSDMPTTEEEVAFLHDKLAMVRAQRGHWINAHQEVVCERDALQRRLEEVEQIVRLFSEDDGTDSIVGKVKELHDCYREQSGDLIALQDRIDAMAKREATGSQLYHMYAVFHGEGHSGVWRYVRDTLLRAPASEPTQADYDRGVPSAVPTASDGPIKGIIRCQGCIEHSQERKPCACFRSECDDESECNRGHLCEKHYYCRAKSAAPQPSPATPSAEDEIARQLAAVGLMQPIAFDQLDPIAQNYWLRVAAEVARREAALRGQLGDKDLLISVLRSTSAAAQPAEVQSTQKETT